jgi:ABC-type antimicrobial peptide transport system permease subunit
MDEWTAYRNPRFQTMVFGSLAFLAVGLVALGVFSIVGFLVTCRTREIGIRMAFGESSSSIRRRMIARAAVPVAAGAVAGFVISFALARFAQAYLFRVQPYSPVTMMTAVVAVIAVGMAASYFPARQASRIDPIQTLKHD